MSSMLRPYQVKIQDLAKFLRGYDPSKPQAAEDWSKHESAGFDPGMLIFCLERVSAPQGLAFGKRDDATESFKVRDLCIVVGRDNEKPLVVNITAGAFELRFLEVLMLEKARKAILDGKDFLYVAAKPGNPLVDTKIREIEQLGAVYAQGGSRRALIMDSSGPQEPAMALLGALGVKLAVGGIGKQPLDIGSICHMLFTPEGRQEDRNKAMVKQCFIPIPNTEAIGDGKSKSLSGNYAPWEQQSKAAATEAAPAAPAPITSWQDPVVAAPTPPPPAPETPSYKIPPASSDWGGGPAPAWDDPAEVEGGPVPDLKFNFERTEISTDSSTWRQQQGGTGFAFPEQENEASADANKAAPGATALTSEHTDLDGPDDSAFDVIQSPDETTFRQIPDSEPSFDIAVAPVMPFQSMPESSDPPFSSALSSPDASFQSMPDPPFQLPAADSSFQLPPMTEPPFSVPSGLDTPFQSLPPATDSPFSSNAFQGMPDPFGDPFQLDLDEPGQTQSPAPKADAVAMPDPWAAQPNPDVQHWGAISSAPSAAPEAAKAAAEPEAAETPAPPEAHEAPAALSLDFSQPPASFVNSMFTPKQAETPWTPTAGTAGGADTTSGTHSTTKPEAGKSADAPAPQPATFEWSQAPKASAAQPDFSWAPVLPESQAKTEAESTGEIPKVSADAPLVLSDTAEVAAVPSAAPEPAQAVVAEQAAPVDLSEAAEADAERSKSKSRSTLFERLNEQFSKPSQVEPAQVEEKADEPVVAAQPAPAASLAEPDKTEAAPLEMAAPALAPAAEAEPEAKVEPAAAAEPAKAEEPPAPAPSPAPPQSVAPPPMALPESLPQADAAAEIAAAVDSALASDIDLDVSEDSSYKHLAEALSGLMDGSSLDMPPSLISNESLNMPAIGSKPKEHEIIDVAIVETPAQPAAEPAAPPEVAAPAPASAVDSSANLPAVTITSAPQEAPAAAAQPAPGADPLVASAAAPAAAADESAAAPPAPPPVPEVEPEPPPVEELQVVFQEPRLVMNEMATLMNRLEQQVAKAGKKLNEKADEVKQRLNDEVSQLVAAAAATEGDHQANVTGLSNKFTKKLDDASEEVRLKISDVAANGRYTIKQLLNTNQSHVEESKNTLYESLRDVCRQFRVDTDALTKSSEERLNKLVYERTEELQNLVNTICDGMRSTNKSYTDKLTTRFDRFKNRMTKEASFVVRSLERNMRFMSEEIEGSWDRAGDKLRSSRVEYEQTISHTVRTTELGISQSTRRILTNTLIPKLREAKGKTRTDCAEHTSKFAEESDSQANGQLLGLEASLAAARQQLQVLVEECMNSIDAVGRGQQAGLEEIFKETSLHAERCTSEVTAILQRTEAQIRETEIACRRLAETSSLDSDPELTEERNAATGRVQQLRQQATTELNTAIDGNCTRLEQLSQKVQYDLSNGRLEATQTVREAAETGLSKLRDAIQEALSAIQASRDKYME